MDIPFFIDLLDIEDYILKLNVKEVTTSAMFSRNSTEPNPDGLLSYTIFGPPGSEQRKTNYGYINLNAKFVHPKVYKDLITLKREIFKDVINGVSAFTVENGELKRVVSTDGTFNVEKGKKVGTGIEFLYQVWDELDFKPRPEHAQQTKEIRQLLSILKKNEIFVTKWLVIPAFYRDVDLKTNRRNEYNSYYIKLIELASMIKASTIMLNMFSSTDAHRKIQATLNDIYNEFVLNKIGGSKGYIQNSVIGKTTEYSARLVISAADFNSPNPRLAETSYSHSGVPLFAVIKIFLPFIAYGIREFFRTYLGGANFIYAYDSKNKSTVRYEIDPTFEDLLSINNLQKRIDLYEESKIHRLEPVTIKTISPEKREIPILYFDGDLIMTGGQYAEASKNPGFIMENREKLMRPLNWTELFYMVSYNTVNNKLCYITRYPIEDHNSIYPTFMNIIPCKKYNEKTIRGQYYPRFPDFREVQDKNYREVNLSLLNTMFPDTLRLFPANLAQLKADFDGKLFPYNKVIYCRKVV